MTIEKQSPSITNTEPLSEEKELNRIEHNRMKEIVVERNRKVVIRRYKCE